MTLHHQGGAEHESIFISVIAYGYSSPLKVNQQKEVVDNMLRATQMWLFHVIYSKVYHGDVMLAACEARKSEVGV